MRSTWDRWHNRARWSAQRGGFTDMMRTTAEGQSMPGNITTASIVAGSIAIDLRATD